MLMEFAEKGDLREIISQNQANNTLIKESEIWKVCRHVSEGLKFLHSKNILHMDIKPQNILYTQ